MRRILRARRAFSCPALAAVGASDERQESIELRPGALLLRVAPWCAPCWGNLAHVDALVPPEPYWMRAADRATVGAGLWSKSPGLPLRVATDGKGGTRAQQGGGLPGTRALLLAKQGGSTLRT